MIFASRYSFPTGILTFLCNREVVQLACTNRQLSHEIRPILSIRQKNFIHSLMIYFHDPPSLIFSLHRSFHDDFERNIRQLFRMIPAWFEYIQANQITCLDVSNPFHHGYYSHHVISSRILSSDAERICDEFLFHLSHNTTLHYCNLGLLYHFISRYDIECAVLKHPTLAHIELILYSGDTNDEPNSLYRVDDGSYEWRHYPPRN